MEEKGGHGGYFRKVLDDSQRYAQELLEKNNELRALVARMQVREQHLEQELAGLQAASDQVKELKRSLLAAEGESQALRHELAQAKAAGEAHARDQEKLKLLLCEVDDDSQRYEQELSDLRRQANNLANLYVASYSLHSTLDRDRLIESIKEIVANLIGSEEMAFYTVDDARQRLVLVDANGLDRSLNSERPLDRGLIATAVRNGTPLVVGPVDQRGPGEEALTAVIPLRLVERVIGAIAIFRLLPQKSTVDDLDRELFDLLASQAGLAFHCAQLHAGFAAGAATR